MNTMLDNASAELLWFLVGLVLLVSELALPGFVIIFFGFGAWITALLVGFGLLPSFNVQLLVFLISSVTCLAIFRRKGKRLFEGKVTRVWNPESSMDDVRGQRAVVLQVITPGSAGGRVEFHGTSWSAESDVMIPAGQKVEITGQNNLTLHVKPLP
jgi:membrane protein implicated in regulation of membrane protease activity